MAQTNRQIAGLFQQMADVTEILGGNRFRVNAFEKAARVLDELTQDVSEVSMNDLIAMPGIGEGTADRIREYLETGAIQEHEDLMARVPSGVIGLLDIPSLGPKSVATLWREGGVTDQTVLRKKLAGGELEGLPRMGKKSLEKIQRNLAFAESSNQRVRIGHAMKLARWFIDRLRAWKPVERAEFAGSLRRGRETIGDLDLLVAADPDRQGQTIADAFVELEPVEEVVLQGPTKTTIRTSEGLDADLRIIEPAAFGAAMLYFTGSKDHNVHLRERAIGMGYKLSEYGLFDAGTDQRVAGETERQVYEKLGLAWIPPELREDRGEIQLAENTLHATKDKGGKRLPDLIALEDIRCELHAHTTASDGVWSIRELVAAAADRGFHTVAVTDHSGSQPQANGLKADRLQQHIEQVRAAAERMKGTIQVLAGSECDILADGRLDYPDHLLKELDLVVASPHNALQQDSPQATRRLLKAMENRYVTIMGHPTGRIVNKRQGLSPDIGRITRAAAERGIAMEINANHHRLDLRDTHARAALEAGCKLSINTDAHGPADMDQLLYGVLTARRAGASRTDVVNGLAKSAFNKWLKSTRP